MQTLQTLGKLDLNKEKQNLGDNLSLPKKSEQGEEKSKVVYVSYQDKKTELANKINKDIVKMPLHELGTDKDTVIKEISKILGVEAKVPAKDIKSQMDDLHSQVQNLDVTDPRFLDSLKGFQDKQTNKSSTPNIAPENIEKAKAVFEVAKSLSDPKGDFRKDIESLPINIDTKDKIIKSAIKDTYKKIFDLIEGDKAVPFAPTYMMGY